MVNQILEIVGIALVLVAAVIVAVVCGTWAWQAGALVACAEAMLAGVILVLLADARGKAEASKVRQS